MNALVRTELLKLAITRSTWILVGGGVTLAALRLLLVLRAAGAAGGIEPGTSQAWTTILGAGAFGSLVVIPLGVVAVTSEWRHRTITATLLVSPDRGALVAAKVIAIAVAAALIGAGLLVGSAGVGRLAGVLTGTPDRAAILFIAGGVAGVVLLAWLGAALGALIRHQTPAVTVSLLWLMAVEPLLGASGLREAVRYLPGGLSSALAGAAGPGAPAPLLAAVLLAAYCAAFAALAVHRLSMTDVT